MSKAASLACILLALSLPSLALADGIALRLNQDSRAMMLHDDSAVLPAVPAITYKNQDVMLGGGHSANQFVAELQVDDFLMCNEFANPGNDANTGLHVRPVHGVWIIGSYDNKSTPGQSAVPGDEIYDYTQGNFTRVNALSYNNGTLNVTACDALGQGPGCNGAALQCFTADSDGHGVTDSGGLFSSGFDDYTTADNSYVKILDVNTPQQSGDTYDYTVQWFIPGGTVPSGRYILQLGYDQAVFSKCGTQSGTSITTILRSEPTASGTLPMHCLLADPQSPPPTSSAPVVVAALFTGPNAHEAEYSDNVAFGRMTSSGPTANLTVNVFDDGTVTASVPPNPLFGDIYLCTSSGGSNCAATYPQGVTVNLQADAAQGHHFVSWNGACSGSNANVGVLLNVDQQCGALFAIDTYTLNYAAGANGSVTGNTTQSVDYGADGTAVTAVPAANYHFKEWTPGGSTDNPRTDTNVAGDISVTAQFAMDLFTVTGQSNGNGSVTPPTQQVAYNDSTTLDLVPDTGYHISGASGCGGSPDGNTYYTGQITADCTVTVDFAIDQFTVTAGSGGGGTITPQSQPVDYGSAATFTVTPDNGHHIVSVTGDTCTPAPGVNGYSASNIQADCNVTAQFAIDQFQVTATVNGGHGSITPAAQTVDYNQAATFSVLPDNGYHVDTISGDYCSPVGGNGNYGVNNILHDCAVSVTFAAN